MDIAVLLLALVLVGIMGGVFFTYAVSVMPGLAETDDRTFVAAFQSIDRAIVNPLFLSVFLGALLATGASGLFFLDESRRGVLWWIVAAFAAYLAAFLITVRVNVPLNDGLKAAGGPDETDPATARERFSEAAWVRWNLVRVVLTLAAFGFLAWAAVAAGRLEG